MWSIRGPLSPRQYWLFALLGLLAPLGLWWFIASGDGVDKVFMPSPPATLVRRTTSS